MSSPRRLLGFRVPLVVARVGVVIAGVGIATAACNAITGTGKYELVDCPNGVCTDAGGSGTSGGAGAPGTDGGSSIGVDSGSDAATAPPLMCGAGLAPVTLTVTASGGSGGSVSAHSGGNLSASAGSTESACLVIGTVEMRTSGPTADWTGPSCKDGNSGSDRCEFQLGAAGIGVTAALH